MRIQEWPEQERHREGTTSFTDRFTAPKLERWRNKVAMTEVQKAHQNSLAQARQKTQTDYFVQLSRKEVAKGESHVIIGMLTECTKFKVPGGCENSKTSVHTNTQENLLMKRNIQQRLPFTFHRTMNDRYKYWKFSRRTRPNTEWDFIMSRTSMFSKEYLGRTRGVIQTGSQNQRNPNAPTFEKRSIEWTLSMEEKQGKQLSFYTRTCAEFHVHILRIETGSSRLVPRTVFLHSVKLHRKRENSVDTGASIISHDEWQWFDSERAGNDSTL